MKRNLCSYIFSIIVLTVILPALLVIAELFFRDTAFSVAVINRWFVFSAIGLRLFFAGLVQLFRPTYTLHTIFKIDDAKSVALVQELGVHNTVLGVCALLTPLFPQYTHMVAIFGGIYFGAAGLLHATRKNKREHQCVAMISDFVIAAGAVLLII